METGWCVAGKQEQGEAREDSIVKKLNSGESTFRV
jgi:hypothetical protein